MHTKQILLYDNEDMTVGGEVQKYLRKLVKVFNASHQKTHLHRVASILAEFPVGQLPKHLQTTMQSYVSQLKRDSTSVRLLTKKEKLIGYATKKLGMTGGEGRKDRGDDMSETSKSDLMEHLQKFLSKKHQNDKAH